jgi:hypothetical protein
VEVAEKEIQYYKWQVSVYESQATGYEEKLGLLRKKGECRT